MDLQLYKVGASGRVALGQLAQDVEFFQAEKDDDTGVITLTPIRVVAPTGRRASVNDAIDATAPDQAADDPDDPF